MRTTPISIALAMMTMLISGATLMSVEGHHG